MNTALSQTAFPLNPLSPKAARQSSGRNEPVDTATRLEQNYARRVVSRLDQSALDLPHDVTERLRFARDRALQKARLARVAEAAASVSVGTSGVAVLAGGLAGRGDKVGDGGDKRWWMRFAAVIPLVALVGGLVVIQHQHVAAQIKAAADIDEALLADDLPPAAYADPAFAEYLKAPRD